MFSAKSESVVCQECGKSNRAVARYCVACAARLGAEPSIVARGRAPPPATAALSGRAGRRGEPLLRGEALLTVDSRPLPLSAAPLNGAGFWFKFGLAGLIVLIGFIGWSLFMLTGSKAPAQLPTGQAGVASAPVVASPAAPAVSIAPAAPVAAASPAAASGAAVALGLTVPPAAPMATPTSRSTAPRASSTVPPRSIARERARPTSSNEARTADELGGWVEPSRAPAMTSSPSYQDAGPPVVSGPGPRDAFMPPVPAAARAERSAATGGADLGPPIAEGPGPRYDYSTPNAAGR